MRASSRDPRFLNCLLPGAPCRLAAQPWMGVAWDWQKREIRRTNPPVTRWPEMHRWFWRSRLSQKFSVLGHLTTWQDSWNEPNTAGAWTGEDSEPRNTRNTRKGSNQFGDHLPEERPDHGARFEVQKLGSLVNFGHYPRIEYERSIV